MTSHSPMQQALLERLTPPLQQSDGSFVASITFDKDFPGFDGHFPGNPVVPAICQLSAVELLAQRALQNDTLKTQRIATMKCRMPLVVDDCAQIAFTVQANDDATVTAVATFHTPKQRNASKIKLILH